MDSNNRFSYNYKGKKYNIIIIILALVILSRLSMYLLYKFGGGIFFEGRGSFIDAFNIWDAGWYRSIIENGYNTYFNINQNGQANWAFFPLYPIIIKLIHLILPININILGTVVSTIFFAGALIMSYLYILETRGNRKEGVLFAIIMSFGVYSFYFSVLYTESLYIFLLITSLYFLHKRDYLLVGIFGALLSATRNMGVMLVFAVAVQYVYDYFKNNKNIKMFLFDTFKNSDLILGISLIPLGLFSYMAYLWKLVGDPMAFSNVQIAWAKTISNPINNLVNVLSNKGKAAFIYLLMWVIFVVVCVICLIIHKRYVEAVLGAIFILIPLSTGLASLPRYIIGSFVYLLAFSDIIITLNKKFLTRLIIIGLSMSEIILLILWFRASNLVC
ncbi:MULTISPECIES: hypothetical protein [unclassified Clostridium]|uniref:hypothetical protein n=1 Tax=unclassified Clostridium TaxID=2614128 RepID=UPI000297FB04|nr:MULTISPECIES: hypothetical protein [unclassified Clostridium]EKQ50521.1 MAG: putative integral membrane protein [Clostridium sp. Maddingley MBC34-26]